MFISWLLGRSRNGEVVDNRNRIFIVVIGAALVTIIIALGFDSVLHMVDGAFRVFIFWLLVGWDISLLVGLICFRFILRDPENDIAWPGLITFGLSAALVTIGISTISAYNAWFSQ